MLMWFLLATISVFMQSLVNYLDEFLTNNNKLPEKTNIHTKVGGLILISTLMSFVGAGLMMFIPHDSVISNQARNLAVLSSIPMVAMYISYFYLLITYPVHQVTPLFLISTLWLLVIELILGGSVTIIGLLGIIILIYGAYILDAGTFKWKVPTKLLLIAIPATSTWAIALYMVRVASNSGSPIAISYLQMLSVGIIGILLLLFIKKYREGFLFRIKNQGKVWLN